MRTISISATNLQVSGDRKLTHEASGDGISFAKAWGLENPAMEQAVQKFWRDLGLVPEAEIEQRLKELCAVAYCNGSIIAVATADPTLVPHLRTRFFQYRCSIARAHRRRELAWRLTAFSHGVLEEWSLLNRQEKIMGLLAIMQSDAFASHSSTPVLTKHGISVVLVGYSPAGFRLRAIWFKHAYVE